MENSMVALTQFRPKCDLRPFALRRQIMTNRLGIEPKPVSVV